MASFTSAGGGASEAPATKKAPKHTAKKADRMPKPRNANPARRNFVDHY